MLKKLGLNSIISPIPLASSVMTFHLYILRSLDVLPGGQGDGDRQGEATAATWPWFTTTHEVIGGRPSIVFPVLMDGGDDQAPEDAVASEVCGPSSSRPTSVVGTCRSQELSFSWIHQHFVFYF